MSLYYREQKHICGKDYAAAGYMEVDLYPVTPKQHKASRRAKKKEACTLAQQTYNDNRSKGYHVQLVNANFGKGDFSWTGTYDDDHLPAPGDTKRADMDWTNYIKRVYRWCDKNGVERPKWVAATEYTTVMADGTICGRHHHHAIIQHTEGLPRLPDWRRWRMACRPADCRSWPPTCRPSARRADTPPPSEPPPTACRRWRICRRDRLPRRSADLPPGRPEPPPRVFTAPGIVPG